jgi:copper chaperone CopZ
MSGEISRDHLAVISIEGMHCHRCEATIQKALAKLPGVHEVEVDFPSRQASVLFNGETVSINSLMDVIKQVGYRATGCSKRSVPEPGPTT